MFPPVRGSSGCCFLWVVSRTITEIDEARLMFIVHKLQISKEEKNRKKMILANFSLQILVIEK